MRNNNHIDKLIIWLYDYDNACQSHSETDASWGESEIWELPSTIADYNTYKLTKVNLLKVNRTTDPDTDPANTHKQTHTQHQTLMCNKSNKADDDAIGLGDWA